MNPAPKRPLATFLLLTSSLLLAEGVRMAWYGIGQAPWEGEPTLRFTIPEDAEVLDLAGSRAADILSYDAATSVRMPVGENSSGLQALADLELIFLEYELGNVRVWVDMFTHSPEVCLSSSGSSLLKTYDSRKVTIEGKQLVFRHLLFQQPLRKNPVHVFKMVWLADMQRLAAMGDDDEFRLGRLAAVRARFVPPGTLTLAIVSGVEGPEEAWNALRARVEQCYRFE